MIKTASKTVTAYVLRVPDYATRMKDGEFEWKPPAPMTMRGGLARLSTPTPTQTHSQSLLSVIFVDLEDGEASPVYYFGEYATRSTKKHGVRGYIKWAVTNSDNKTCTMPRQQAREQWTRLVELGWTPGETWEVDRNWVNTIPEI